MREWQRLDLRRETSEWWVLQCSELALFFCTQTWKNTCWWFPGCVLHGPGPGVRTRLPQVQDPEGRMLGPAGTLPWGSVCSQVHQLLPDSPSHRVWYKPCWNWMFANAVCPCVAIFCEWTRPMRTPCMSAVSVCIMRTALTRPSNSLSKPCAWLPTTKRLDWHAEWVYLYATGPSTVVFQPKWLNQIKCSLRCV